jgi:hypothetical protein
LAARDHIAEWLRAHRLIALKDPQALPARTDRRASYLGYRVSRRGLSLGPKARGRLAERIAGKVDAPDRLRAALVSYRAAWTSERI